MRPTTNDKQISTSPPSHSPHDCCITRTARRSIVLWFFALNIIACQAGILSAQAGATASAQNLAAAAQDMRNLSAVSIKDFGAIGDGSTDDTAAINAGFAFMATKRVCLFFPAGAYKITTPLAWTSHATLCLFGAPQFASYIEYVGSAQVDAAVTVKDPQGGFAGAVDVRDFGFAANKNAKYAFHGVNIGTLSTMDTVAFAGGSESAFEGDFWNGQGDLRNLMVVPAYFDPTKSGCFNGLTFSSAIFGGKPFPSNQFTLTQPTVEYCKNIGLNLQQVTAVVVNGGQISTNHQQFYENCNISGCNAVGNIFNDVLLETFPGEVANQLYGNRNIFNGLLAANMQIFGSGNTFNDSQMTPIVEGGAITSPTSISVASNIATVIAANNYVPWQVGVFSGLQGSGVEQMNGKTLTVLPTGLSVTQFEVAYENGGVNLGPIPQSGAAFTPPQGDAAAKFNVFNSNYLTEPGAANFGYGTTGFWNVDQWGKLVPGWNSTAVFDSTTSGSECTAGPVKYDWIISNFPKGVYDIGPSVGRVVGGDWRAIIHGVIRTGSGSASAASYEITAGSPSLALPGSGQITFANNPSAGRFQATIAGTPGTVSFSGWVEVFPAPCGTKNPIYSIEYASPIQANGGIVIGTNSVPAVGTPVAGHVACIKSVGHTVVLGYCSSISPTGACTCN